MTFKRAFPFCRKTVILGSSISEWMKHKTQADWDQTLFLPLTSCVSQPVQVGTQAQQGARGKQRQQIQK